MRNKSEPTFKVGIIGGYGKFGGSLYNRLQKSGMDALRSKNKSDNVSIAKTSDVVALCVPPPAAQQVIKEISGSCNEVLSFVAGLDIEKIRAHNIVRITRAMADPYFCFLAHTGDSFAGSQVALRISENFSLLDTDRDMEEFTIDLGLLLVLFSMKKYEGLLQSAILKFSKYFPGVDINDALKKHIPNLDSGLIAPKKGLSEFLFNLLAENSNITFSELRLLAGKKLKSMLDLDKMGTDQRRYVSNQSLKSRLIMPIALAAMTTLAPACKRIESKSENSIVLPERKKHGTWDSDKEYFREVEKGQFSTEEYQKRLRTLPNGEVIFEDIGSLTFYRVEKGDSIEIIRNKLSKYQRFAYLKTMSHVKIKSFNVPQRSLTPGMLIPIPLDQNDRSTTDAQFVHYCNDAINEMAKDSRYGEMIKKIIKKTSKREILIVMLAIAKQESGGEPIGQFELHRWESHQSAFSFSLFHVLMKGAGLQARQNLNMTEGQLYHPKNAAKLFLAFLCEKSRQGNSCDPEKFFPLMKNLDSFATFYNGSAWKRINPNYTRNLTKYYFQAKQFLNDKSGKLKFPVKDEKSRPTQSINLKTPEAVGDLHEICKKVNGAKCVLEAKEYSINRNLLERADASSVPGAANLRQHYCRRIKYLLEGQKSGRFRRPEKNWTETYRRRKNYIRRKCGE